MPEPALGWFVVVEKVGVWGPEIVEEGTAGQQERLL